MSNEIKHIASDALASPKIAIGITAFFTSHLWLDYGEPLIRGIGTILGLVVVCMVIYKLCLEIKYKRLEINALDSKNKDD